MATLERMAVVAATAASGGWLARIHFFRLFTPRICEHLVRDAASALTTERFLDGVEKELELSREVRRELENRLAKVRALVPRWRAMTPGVDNGWADELEEALTDEAALTKIDPRTPSLAPAAEDRDRRDDPGPRDPAA